ncbi:MAG: hypothetical protein KDK54_22840 [Leptospiraceae bacterium]|nr:hypothetical protein [Leptospiraceae bacterium]
MKKEVGDWIEYYNFQRLHSSLQYVALMDVVECKQKLILAERKRKLLEGKQMRKKYSESLRNNLEAVNA